MASVLVAASILTGAAALAFVRSRRKIAKTFKETLEKDQKIAVVVKPEDTCESPPPPPPPLTPCESPPPPPPPTPPRIRRSQSINEK